MMYGVLSLYAEKKDIDLDLCKWTQKLQVYIKTSFSCAGFIRGRVLIEEIHEYADKGT